MRSTILGYTGNGLAIWAHQFGISGPEILILAGVHGDEAEGIIAAYGLMQNFKRSFPFRAQVTIVPEFNLDGLLQKTRTNAHGVDLNRNLPTHDWTAEVTTPRYHPGPNACSETESQALVEYLADHRPRFIISLHSWHPCLNVNGRCRTEAQVISSLTGYEITESIGYPTPGCLGSYAGLERDIPTLTYEVERGQSAPDILRVHVPALIEAIKVVERQHAV